MSATVEALHGVDPDEVGAMAAAIHRTWKNGKMLLACGNGGSASTASHLAADLAKQTRVAGAQPLRALALTDSVETLTAWGNDSGFENVFSEQVRVYGRQGDALLCLSCSGNSENLVAAAELARELGMTILVVGGFGGGRLRHLADAYVHVPSNDYGVVESVHLAIEHCLAALMHEAVTASVAATRPDARDGSVVILDRDGVINRNLDGGVRSWEEFEFLPGALEGLAQLSKRGHRVVVVTNQANIGRGVITPAQLDDIHVRMLDRIVAAGGWVEAVHICPHLPTDGCSCRKPGPGLLHKAAQQGGFALERAFFIGDHETDVMAARAAGATPVLVLSGRGNGDSNHNPAAPDIVASDLRAAAELITKQAGVTSTSA